MIPTPHELLEILRPAVSQADFRYGHIHTSYTSGRPRVRFDGETAATTETYPRLASYTPVADERVLLARTGSGWIVLGEVV